MFAYLASLEAFDGNHTIAPLCGQQRSLCLKA
jgi:hypothetical protein